MFRESVAVRLVSGLYPSRVAEYPCGIEILSAAQTILKYYPFGRLSRLLDGHAPGDPGIDVPGHAKGAPVLLSIGEPQDAPPAFIVDEIAKAAATFSRYPPARGTPEYLEACAAWLDRRYGLPSGMIDPKTMILAVPGSREGLFFAALAASHRLDIVPLCLRRRAWPAPPSPRRSGQPTYRTGH